MQYIKALFLVVFFFLAMVFLCQNQVALSENVTLQLNLLVVPPTPVVELPFYFVMMAAFLLGAVFCFLLLLWDRVSMSARTVRANWRMRSMQNEQLQMIGQLRQLAQAPQDVRAGLFEKFKTGYEGRKRAREHEEKKDDIKHLTIEATASAQPSKAVSA